ncbi:MAG: MFS transporter [Clostridia bacterium]|nr:MFS transporter [Clostridia bacterium]
MSTNRINKTKEEKTSWFLFVTAWIVYAIISMTKSAYNASMASIIGDGLFDKTQAGTISASFYLFYGLAQLLGVKILDKISPMRLVLVALIGTLISIIGMALSKSFIMMLVIWSLCGLVQFPIWPAILRIIAEYLTAQQRDKAMVYIAFSYCVGMFVNYIAASAVLRVAEWRMLFWVFAVIMVFSIALWQIVTAKTKAACDLQARKNKELLANELNNVENKPAEKINFFKLLTVSGLIIVFLPSLARSAIDMGMKTWIPTMITESYGVSESFASMLTSILVFVNLGGVYIANWLYPKRINNAVTAYGICFLVSLPFNILLLLTGKVPVGVIVVLLTVTTTMMYAGHQLINVIIPSYFAKYGRTGSVAALLNAVASFGIVIANISFGYLAQHFGWGATIISWIIIVSVSLIACAAATPIWEKFTAKKD